MFSNYELWIFDLRFFSYFQYFIPDTPHIFVADLFDVFIREKIYLEYARRFLEPEQIDEVDLTQIPGYPSSAEEPGH